MSDELKFEAKDKPLSTVFFSERKYRVPRYQRPYTWDSEQITEFREDLTAQGEPYFFGSMIFNTEAEKTDGYADIIDGQQRLLTVTILTAVLRDLANELDKERAKLYQRKDIAIEDRDGREFYRVVPSDPLMDYFRRFIQSGEDDILQSSPSTQEEARVKRNYEYFREKVSAELKRCPTRESQLDLLGKLRKRIGDLIVISIEIGREEDAYDIFETTNARGIELSVSDLLKNLIFNRIRAGGDRDLAKDIWQDISSNIESTRTELKRFIRYYWISKYGFTPDKKLYRTIKSKVTDWQALLQDLWEDSERYNRLLESGEQDFQDLKHGPRIYAAVSALRLMRVSQCYILLLCVLRNIASLNTDPTRIFEL